MTTLTQARSRGQYAIEQYPLDNAVRVVLAPDLDTPAVCVAVSYAVGARSEPPGRAGFAHLLEHLTYHGRGLGRHSYAELVEEAGGSFNGTTWSDSTIYHATMPPGGLARGLFLEAARMAGPAITEPRLRNEVAVVTEEVRTRTSGRPYGRFPAPQLRALLFDSHPNRHDGFGWLADLTAATVPEVAGFFQRWYGTGNAVLCVAGRFDTATAARLVDRYLAGIPPRPAPPPADLDEPGPVAERRRREVMPRAPAPAFAAAWRVPDPVRQLPALLPYLLLAEVLAGSELSRLPTALGRGPLAVGVSAAVGLMGDPLSVRHPTALVIEAYLAGRGGGPDPALRVIDEELARLAERGPAPAELAGARAAVRASMMRTLDPVTGRARQLATLAQLHGDARLGADLPDQVEAVAGPAVAAAAATLRPDRRAVVEVVPPPGTVAA